MHSRILPTLVFIFVMLFPPNRATSQSTITIAQNSDRSITVKVDNELFTRYDFKSYAKPIFYPVLGPQQQPMTRGYPMKKQSGEADDHPHHKSMWLGHEINGIDFWTEKGGKVQLQSIKIDEAKHSFVAKHQWVITNSNKVIANDKVTATFGSKDNVRWIDYQIEFWPTDEPLVFNDTKEGFFAIRVHPNLRTTADPKRGVERATGQMENSEGQQGKKIWGKKARWVHYFGKTDERRTFGIVMMDHPSNLRHPTTWHARDYGLLAANPFGLHHFQKADKGAGEYSVPVEKSVNFHYRTLFHVGVLSPDQIEKQFQSFAKQK